ncbi:MAG: hypothetical protein KDB27_08545 [Planctomycetales bacterium]|nr:hypothetical protein [Planctomycetales bacterium]
MNRNISHSWKRFGSLAVILLSLLCLPVHPIHGQDGESVGRLVRINLPIVDSDDTNAKRTIDRIVDSLPQGESRPTLVLEFRAERGQSSAGSEFERCLSLANYLSRLTTVRTVAFVPETLVGHAVLPVLACEEIVIAENAKFGDAGHDDSNLGATVRRAYVEIAESRRTVPPAIALGMLDSKLRVFKADTNSGTLFVLESELDSIKVDRIVRSVETQFEAETPGLLRGAEMRDLGFASYLADDRNALAAALNIPVTNLEFDPSMGGEWRAIRLELRNVVNDSSVNRIISTIDQQITAIDANFICLEIDSEGGSLSESSRLANYIADLDRSKIRTVAFVSGRALADTALVAFACDHLVVTNDAKIGGSGTATITEEQISDSKQVLERIADQKSDYWSLTAAMIDPHLQVYTYQQSGRNRKLHLCEDELHQRFGDAAEQEDRVDRWIRGDELTSGDSPLQLDGRQAGQLGYARFVVEDFSELRQLYQLDDIPELTGPNWAFQVVEVIARPEVAALLLVIGILSLYIELSSPGIGIGGFVGTVCFALYFWSNFMNGTAEWLEIVLFLLGIVFVCMEVFVLPGFGIFGLGGGAMILASLILATQTFIMPTNEYQTEQLLRSMMTVFGAIVAVMVLGVTLRKHLPNVPVLGRMMLAPPVGEDLEELTRRESIVDYEYLLGQIGTAKTRLSPAGKAIFGDDLVDVISQGEMIGQNDSIVVIEVLGNRVVVESAG